MHAVAHIGPQRRRDVARVDTLKQVAKPLSPRHGRRLRSLDELDGIELFDKFGKDGRNVVEPAGMMMVADKVDGGELRRRYGDLAARRVERARRDRSDA